MWETDNIWAKRPEQSFQYENERPYSSETRHTWAGPINPQLYGDGLRQLSHQTEKNIKRLENKNASSSHSFYRSLGIDIRDKTHEPVKRNHEVLFTARDSLSSITGTSINDDASSVMSESGPLNICYLCSTLDEHRQHLQRMRIPKKSAQVKKQTIKYLAPKPKVKKPEPKEPVEHFTERYKVIVWTGTHPEASSDANVFISLKGDEDVLLPTQLTRGHSKRRIFFAPGSKETFFIKGPQLGNLEILSIEHDGMEKKHGWYCEKVEITCMRTLQHWVFVCKNWLSLHHGDFSLARNLEARYLEKKIYEYECTVITGKKRMAGTDANICVTFHGNEGYSSKIHLTAPSRKQLFNKGSVDKFRFSFKDIGTIQSVRVEHDGRGVAAGWFLDRLILQSVDRPNVVYYFLLNGWLARDIGDGHLWRDIPAKKKLAKEVTTGKPVNYQVSVKTGDVRYAGTDANVYIIIQGKKGTTKKMFMDDSRDNFERGQTEVFELNALDVGPIIQIQIGHDNSGPGAGWYCEDVTIKKYLHHDDMVSFLKNLKKKRKPKDKRKKRLSDKLKERQMKGMHEEESEEEEDRDEEEEETDEEDKKYKDVFDIDGKVTKIPHYEEYFFECKNWFATDEGDGRLERELEVKKKTIFFQDRTH